MDRDPIPHRLGFARPAMPRCGVIRYYPGFRPAIPVWGAGWSRVTHPFATLLGAEAPFPFDLHVLSTPPAFILSQDQTLHSKAGRLPRDEA